MEGLDSWNTGDVANADWFEAKFVRGVDNFGVTVEF